MIEKVFIHVAVVALICLGIDFVFGQDIREHLPEHQSLHDRFYSNWMRPPGRVSSCCSQQDCYPLDHTNLKKNGETWFILNKFTNQWNAVPENLIESNQPDARDSPDGRGHVCANWSGVLCIVLGSQG